MPAWVAGTDYWRAFVAKLAEGQPEVGTRQEKGGALEKRAGIFYLSPAKRYNFAHPQSVGHDSSPFHAVWFCGGWPDEAQRREAAAALAPLRKHVAGPRVEVFRASTMLQKRGHYELGRETRGK
uniref:Uncharacterized protein n=1 Tax=uncultured organism MedDCM-OCT-S12-C54 TaxID=743665 RepID=D6PJG2_9ZZZZ|nr:hypothetical protein [uncultured organism MedDCM-OCT-S12-C54]